MAFCFKCGDSLEEINIIARHAAGTSVNYSANFSTVPASTQKVVPGARPIVVPRKVKRRKSAVKNTRKRVKIARNALKSNQC